MTPPLIIYRKNTTNVINILPRSLYINVKIPLQYRKYTGIVAIYGI